MINCKELVISLLGLTAATALVYAAGTAPVIITQPQSQTVSEGESVTFSVIAEDGGEGYQASENFTTSISSTVNLDMIWIEPGTFIMGSPEDELGRRDFEFEDQHQVTLTKGYWLGKYEVTQAQYRAVTGKNPASGYGIGDNRPVYYVGWRDAMDFCAKLTEIERTAGRLPNGYEYTLPTEAQWEYACRAGTTTAFNNGTNIPTEEQRWNEPCPNLDPVAWYSYNCGWITGDNEMHPVGQKQPNAWGFYDMHGNVEEWCLDWYGDYPTGAVIDPQGASTGEDRVMRGGTFSSTASGCRSAYRHPWDPNRYVSHTYGFRVALAPVQVQTYQWYKDGNVISGATYSSYTIGSVKASDAGSYTVTVINGNGSVTSDAAILTVMSVQREVSVTGNKATVMLTISNAPKGYSAALEEVWQSKALTFSDISNGGTAFETEEGMKVSWSGSSAEGNYQIPGTLTYTASVPEGTSVTVALSGKLEITTSQKIIRADITTENVTFTSAPVITAQPQSQTVSEGESVTFSVIAESGSEYQEGENFTTPISGTVNLDMIWIEPGTFMMGSPEDELGRRPDEVQHQVTLTQGYWLGKYEVTQAQYEAVMGANPSEFSGDNNPVECVSWNGAMAFCNKLTEIEKAAGRLPVGYEYTLPTEAQWEYACRAGTTTALNSGKNLSDTKQCPEMDEVGWYTYNSDKQTHLVGQKQPNAWELYDMHGNVSEWCLDWSGEYPTEAVTDPKGPSDSAGRVLRGGNWYGSAAYCRSAYRGALAPDRSDKYYGFRIALCRTTEDILIYQWYKDGTAISGATASSYTIGSVKASDAGSYTVIVSNGNGSVTSDAAVLTIKTTPSPDVLSVQREVSVTGNKATVTLTISDAPKGYIAALEENWQSKILTFSGISNDGTATETENGMKVSWSGFDMSGNYQFPGTLTYTASVPEGTSATVALSGQLMITTSNGVVSADIAVQNVTFTAAPSAPVITAQPKSLTVSEGGSVTFSVTATGSEPLFYQWMKDGAVISGATGSSYTIGSVKASDAGTYVVMIMNALGSAMSSPAVLTLAQEGAPELKLEPAGSGKWKITFTGTLQESTDMKSWQNVSGTQGGTYTFSPASGKKFFRAAK